MIHRGALSRNLGTIASDVDANWCSQYVRFLMAINDANRHSIYGDKAIELVDNSMNHTYDSKYRWILNRVTSDWSSLSNSAKEWYDVLQAFIDTYRVFGDTEYLTFAQTCFDDIQQANSTVVYLLEMNRDWTPSMEETDSGREEE